MKLPEKHQELLKTYYPQGYQVSNGEERHYHVMFVDVLNTRGVRQVDRAVFQKYLPYEWGVMERNIKNLGILVTGHHEYSVIYDPVEYAEEQRVKKEAEAKAKVEAEEAERKAEQEKEAALKAEKEEAERKAEAKRVEKEKAEAIEKARLAKEAKAKEVKPEPEPAAKAAPKSRSKAPQKE